MDHEAPTPLFDEAEELRLFQIISHSGMAKSTHIEAVQLAKQGQFESARQKMKEAETFFLQCHHIHTEMVQQEAGGQPQRLSLILIHAEDQMASCEITKLLAGELIELYERLEGRETPQAE